MAINIYTDGSSCNYIGGFGWVTTSKKAYGKIKGKCTNQKAELYAIYDCLNYFSKSIPRNICINIYTDSQYSINIYTQWYKSWEKNNWKTSKNREVLHKNLIIRTLNLLKERKVNFIHVKGHSGNKMNEIADSLANKGRELKEDLIFVETFL